jgi:hypothetical protein
MNMVAGRALILGDMPLETTSWISVKKGAVIVRAFFMDPNVDVSRLLAETSDLDFSDPIEVLTFDVKFGHMMIYDSAVAGLSVGDACLRFDVPIGKHQVLTKIFAPNSRTSLLMHWFV